MKRTEALHVMAVLTAGMPGAFEEETTALWLEFVEGLDNPGKAVAAARDYVKSWKGYRPAWGEYEACYQARSRQDREERPALPSGNQPISCTQYLDLVAAKADRGDRAATKELDDWRRMGRPGGIAGAFVGDWFERTGR